MSSKKTDYVNAQFDDAEAKIQALFDEINKDAGGAEISTNYFNGNGQAAFILIYKKGKTVHLVAACLINTGHGFSNTNYFTPEYEWGMVPTRYYAEHRMTVNGKQYYRSFEIYPKGDGRIEWYIYNSGAADFHFVGPAGPMIIKASWRA